MKQLQMEKYLQLADDGWIMRRARYYRGAVQAEDEEAWGLNFLTWVLANDGLVTSEFFLIRQVSKDIPHQSHADGWKTIRALSKTISDSLPSFTNLRVKLHGKPEAADLQRVRDFYDRNRPNISPKLDDMIQALAAELESAYRPSNVPSLRKYLAKLPAQSSTATQLRNLIRSFPDSSEASKNDQALVHKPWENIAKFMWNIRSDLLAVKSPNVRLTMMDLSNELERIFFRDIGTWQPETIGELLEKNYTLAKVAAGCGFLEVWEWEIVEPILRPVQLEEYSSLEAFVEKAYSARRAVEWGTGMIRAMYDPVVALFSGFEPLVAGFSDEQIRSSILLSFGEAAWQLMDTAERLLGLSNNVMGVKNPNQIRGLNPGFALGELEVISGAPEGVSFLSKKIYVLPRAPADLKPVAGIATVAEGNLVSHVQLLARNLGIPNAVLSQQNLNDLLPFSGQMVFYAVSPRGAVVMKPEAEMTDEERVLVESRKRREERVKVPTHKINLRQSGLISLNKLRASDSGRICGPKAANLGQLKSLFPDKVADGLVIPFGVFRKHLDQPMPGTHATYWHFLEETFAQATQKLSDGRSDEEVESQVLKRLTQLREALKNMPFLPDFQGNLRRRFREEFGVNMGEVPVFIRSDTNMEDLREFTGAGLNLTVFNVVGEDKILQGIREVWASPYAERSYRWRQKYLLNPENVYPSILILPTVVVDKSGVMITTGMLTSDPRDITIAFNRGAGGAVEGQAAESYLLRHDGGALLLSPSRETNYMVLPKSGGILKDHTHFNRPILSPTELNQLRGLAAEIEKKLPGVSGIESAGPFDVELGFQDEAIWLFQVRPYVENKRARSSLYLRALDPRISENVRVSLGERP
ncbi:MAG: PEP/pyruvate-binding domain-containing protein [Candidatus Latescibacterota bacterium]